MFTEESLNELQKHQNLKAVCDALDLDRIDETNIYICPFCKNESFVINSNSYNESKKYYCFECEEKGDAISLVQKSRNKSFKTAIEFLSILFDVPIEETNRLESTVRKNRTAQEKV